MLKKLRNGYFKIFLLAIAILVGYRMINGESNIFTEISQFIKVLNPLIIGSVIAYILYIPVSRIERILVKSKIEVINKRARGISVSIVYFVIFMLIFAFVKWFIPFIYNYTIDLIKSVPSFLVTAEEYFKTNPLVIFDKEVNILPEIEKIRNTDIFKLVFQAESGVILSQITKAVGIITSIFDIFMTIILSIYMLLYKESVQEFLKKFLLAYTSKRTTNKIKKYVEEANYIFFKFITIQILDSIIVSIMISIALVIMNVKYSIALGFLIGMSNLIPFFGAIVGVGIAAILTIFTGGIAQAFLVLAVAIVLQQFDANIINPIMLGSSLELNKILIIISVIVFGYYFGALGMFFAVPATKVFTTIISDNLDYKIRKKAVKKKLEARKKIKLAKYKEKKVVNK